MKIHIWWTSVLVHFHIKYPFGYWVSLLRCVFHVFFSLRSAFQCFTMSFVHCSRDSQTSFFNKIFIKNESPVLFTHLKIILLQCFQFLIFSKISGIQTHSKWINEIFINILIRFFFLMWIIRLIEWEKVGVSWGNHFIEGSSMLRK